MENFKCPHCDKEIDSVLIKNHFKESEKKRLRNEIEKEIGGENDKKIEARLMRERESDKMKLEQERERDKLKMDRLKKAMLRLKTHWQPRRAARAAREATENSTSRPIPQAGMTSVPGTSGPARNCPIATPSNRIGTE